MSVNSKLDFEAIKANKNITVRTYWKDRLEGFVLEDYFGKSNITASSENTAKETIGLQANDQLYKIVTAIADSDKAKHIILLSALGILAQKYSSHSDIAVFTPAYLENKSLDSTDTIIPVRMHNFENRTFPKFLAGLKNDLIQDFNHSDYPLKRIMNKEEEDLKHLSSVGMVVEGIQDKTALQTVAPDLVFAFNVENGLSLKIVYNAAVHSPDYIRRMGEHYFHLLLTLILNKEKEIKDIELISEVEKSLIINEFNQTEKAFPKDKTILDFFASQVIKTPDNVAVQFAGNQLSYKELDEKSNQVAHFLKQKYSDTGIVFGVQLERSIELMVAIFGILKAGGIYLPLSKNHPAERILYTLENSKAKAVFTEPGNTDDFGGKFDCLKVDEAFSYPTDSLNLAQPNEIAYIIYTSGSTGKPKGVLIKHGSVVNRLHWMQNEYQLDQNDAILQKTPLVFDVSIWELFLWSMSGAKLVLASPGAEKNPQELCEIIQKENITVLHFVPSMLNALFVYLNEYKHGYTLERIKNLFTSGEELKAADAKMFLAFCPKAQLHNLYGPTEATVDVSFHQVSRSADYRSIPIGKPIDNTQLFICNDQLQLQPVGIPGELLIGGVNLSVGYVGQPELTKERFIENPFNKGTFLYKTGDLAKWSEDGNIEYLGRIDNQVKIRGNRIELGEIEFTIQSFTGIKGAVVLAKETKTGTQLVGYLVTGADFSENNLRDFLASKLPEYMMPSYFITIEKIPVTVNGKVNREALLSLQIQHTDAYAAPETDLEKSLVAYWSGVLANENIGINDSFFRIGGDSILAIKLIGTINNELSTNISMIDLYENDTIKKLADFLGQTGKEDFSETFKSIANEVEEFNANYKNQAKNDLIENVYPMSDIEKAMCFIHKSRPDDILYFEQLMQPVAYETLDIEVLQNALDLLVQKHEILRTGFDIDNFAHIIYKEVDTTIVFHDYSSFDKEEQKRKIEEDMEKSRPAHFDLQAEKLWRIIVYKLKESHHEILFEYHHAIIDGWSFASLLTELNNTYLSLLRKDAVPFNKLETSFKDYIVQELFYKQNEETLAFWKNDLKDFKRLKLNKTTDAKIFKSVRDVYPAKLLADLEETAKKKKTSVKNILLSAYIYSMKMLSGQNDILVGLVTFTRPLKKDGEKLLGCFLNTIPFRIKVPEAVTWSDYLAVIDKKVLEIKKYEHLSLFEINQAIGGGNLGNPLFDTFFNYINWHVKVDMEVAKTVDDGEDKTYFDTFLRGNTFFDANYDVTNNNIICMHEYSSPFMTEDTYSQYSAIFLSVLDRIIEAPEEIINPKEFFWDAVIEDTKSDLQQFTEANPYPENKVPMSYHQEKQLFEAITSEKGQSRNISLIGDIEGVLNIELLERSIQHVIDRHAVLRTKIVQTEDNCFQEILEEGKFKLQLNALYPNQEEVDGIIEAEKIKPFGTGDFLVRASVVRLMPKKFRLIVVFHSAVADHYSAEKLAGEILSFYQSGGDKEKPAEETLQYSSFALWQQKSLLKLLPNLFVYWKKQLNGSVKEVELPYDMPKNPVPTYTASQAEVAVPEDLAKKIEQYAQKYNLKSNVILMAAFKIALHKYSQQEEVIIGAKVANRNDKKLKNTIGPISNILPIRSFVSEASNFNDYVTNLNEIYAEALEHQLMPFDLLAAELFGENNNTMANSLLNVLFQYEEEKNILPNIEALTIRFDEINDSFEKYDLKLLLRKEATSITGKLTFNADYFSQRMIGSFLKHYYGLIENLITNPNEAVASVGLVSPEEKHHLIHDFNATSITYPEHGSIISLFESQVLKTPENTALRYDGKQMSYVELHDKVSDFSYYLRGEHGVSTGDLVGVMLEREELLIPSLFGILKAGGAYVPIDVTLPADRIDTILRDAKIKTLVTRGKHLPSSKELAVTVVDLDKETDIISGYKAAASDAALSPSDLAYVIYTSGSTGTPKGVMIEHGSLLNIIQCMDRRYPLKSSDSYLLKTTYSFDVSVAELFGWFHSGGSLSLLPSGAEKDPVELLSAIAKDKITHINFVPSMFSVFMDAVKKEGISKIASLKYIFLAGEALPKEMVMAFNSLNAGIRLENIYGPTEGTIYSCGYSTGGLKDAVRVPIGQPLDNVNLYVLDKGGNLQPIGVPGELCIGGRALARGYLHNEALTSEKFVRIAGLPEERVYKTGDLVRWLSDGNIEYLGRIDNQVKVRGFRIELGEIESQLQAIEGVEQSAVDLKEKDGDKYLVAYYVSDKEWDASELKGHLLKKLPEYMLPSYYVRLAQLPLTASGKLSRKQLPDPEITTGEDYVGPSNEIEEKLIDIWSEVLKLDKERISVNRSFFELGGHSLKAIVLVNRIAKELKMTLPLEQVFEQPTIQKQAVFIEINKWLDSNSYSEKAEEMTESVII